MVWFVVIPLPLTACHFPFLPSCTFCASANEDSGWVGTPVTPGCWASVGGDKPSSILAVCLTLGAEWPLKSQIDSF